MARSGIDRGALLVQRRLLLTFTFVLAAIYLLNVKLSDNATAFGLVATFDNPELLVVALWIAWAWSWWRYWQYEKSYVDAALEQDLLMESRRRVRETIISLIQRAVDAGEYAGRGLHPGEKISVSTGFGDEFGADFGKEEWSYPSLNIYRVAPADGKPATVEGGANCSLSRNEVAEIRRAARRAVLLRRPHFADWKAPYVILWLAPAAWAVAAVRYCIETC